MRELEAQQAKVLHENEELKQLCLYLDEQRHHVSAYRTEDDRESEDLGRELSYTGFTLLIAHLIVMLLKWRASSEALYHLLL